MVQFELDMMLQSLQMNNEYHNDKLAWNRLDHPIQQNVFEIVQVDRWFEHHWFR